ncbi:MAG TPA: RDD family protein [Acidimicrobiia bacterium]|nr:RDD family protein [Acidimicrobiia bacterium]
MTTPEPPEPQETASPFPLADWGTRAVGLIIDYLPILILSALTFWSDFLGFFGGLIGVAYTIFMGYLDGLTGQTPGKAVMGTRLVNEQGDVIGAGAGVGRKFVHIVDSMVCLLGWLLPLVDEKRQTIADKLMQTYVVTGAEKKQFSVDLWRPPQQQGS